MKGSESMIVFYGALIASVLSFLAVCAWYTDKIEVLSDKRRERLNRVKQNGLMNLRNVNREIIKMHIDV